MTTALYVFYARALLLAVYIVLLILATVGVVFAQDAVAAPADGGLEGIITLVRDGLIAGVVALVGLALSWVQAKLPAWLSARINLAETAESLDWRKNLQEAITNGITHARIAHQLEPGDIKTWADKSKFIGTVMSFIGRYEQDIVSFFDKDQNGIPDLVEIELAKLAPDTMKVRPPGSPQTPPMEMGFMAEAPRRVTKTPREMAETLKPVAQPIFPPKPPRGAGARSITRPFS